MTATKNPLKRGYIVGPQASNVVEKIGGFEVRGAITSLSVVSTVGPKIADKTDGAIYVVVITDPISVNKMYATNFKTGRRFISKDGETYAGHKKTTKSRGEEFIPGRLHTHFIEAGLPLLPDGRKIVVEAYATWPSKPRRVRDMSNLQKPIEDALQKGGFIKNDCFLLWRNMDFKFGDRSELKLVIYELKDADGTGVDKNEQREG